MMKSLWVLCCSLLLCVSFSDVAFAATDQASVTVDRSLSFRALPHPDYLEFRWKRYPKPSAFQMYFIVRSEAGGPSEPDAGDIVATTTNRYSTNLEDRPTRSAMYFYRLCIQRKDGDRVCSKVVRVPYRVRTRVESFQRPLQVIVSSSVSASASTTNALAFSAPDSELALRALSSASGTILTWTPLATGDGAVREVDLVRSFTTSSLSYPTDGYLAKIAHDRPRTFTDTVYTDPELTRSPRWYRACAVLVSDRVTCGTPILVTP